MCLCILNYWIWHFRPHVVHSCDSHGVYRKKSMSHLIQSLEARGGQVVSLCCGLVELGLSFSQPPSHPSRLKKLCCPNLPSWDQLGDLFLKAMMTLGYSGVSRWHLRGHLAIGHHRTQVWDGRMRRTWHSGDTLPASKCGPVGFGNRLKEHQGTAPADTVTKCGCKSWIDINDNRGWKFENVVHDSWPFTDLCTARSIYIYIHVEHHGTMEQTNTNNLRVPSGSLAQESGAGTSYEMIRSQSEKGCLDDGSVRGLRSTLQLGPEDSATFLVALAAEILGQAFATHAVISLFGLNPAEIRWICCFILFWAATQLLHICHRCWHQLIPLMCSKTLQILQDVWDVCKQMAITHGDPIISYYIIWINT